MANINLRYGYRGHMSKEKFIPAGTYDDHDPVLMGIVAYLVKNGHATVIEVEPTVDEEHEDKLPIFVNGVGFVDEPPEVTFTDAALEILEVSSIPLDSIKRDFALNGIERVTKRDAIDYMEEPD
mgnify:FL=1